jgi:phage tail-like protein
MSDPEFITISRYYFNVDGIGAAFINKIESVNVQTPPSEQIQGVGKNGVSVRQSTPTVAKMGTIKLTLGLTANKELHDWYARCNKSFNEASEWKNSRKTGSIIGYNQAQEEVARWDFTNCYPVGYSVPNFAAAEAGMALENVEISFESIVRRK